MRIDYKAAKKKAEKEVRDAVIGGLDPFEGEF